jgi:hypothetical protein
MTEPLNVWTYWEGMRPPYIDLCLRTMARACAESGVSFRQLGADSVDQFLKPGVLHENYRILTAVGPKVSAIRAALLAYHGGWWWDADTIALRSPTALMRRYPRATMLYMTWTRLPLRILNGYIYAAKGCPAASEWLAAVNRMLAEEPERANRWLELGEKTLTPLLRDRDDCAEVPRQLFLPIDIDSDVGEFFWRENPFRYLREDAICYGLNHSWFWAHRQREMCVPSNEWGQSDLLIHRLLHFAREGLLR